ncbi:MAG: TolC family protein [Isosphaeraceae bacterium]|nr:TolC family protein [Isosphaeraceae bacterium]
MKIRVSALLIAAAAGIAAPECAIAQGPTFDSSLMARPGGAGSSLGAAPGSGANTLGNSPGAGANSLAPPPTPGVFGGRPGTSTTRVSPSITTPNGMEGANAPTGGIAAPRPQPTPPVARYGSLELVETDDEGPPSGLTLDQAIDRAVRDNLDLRSKFMEVPQAQADILNASLRANPVFYADGQLVPYGNYSRARAGGPTQYDVNISYPLDLSRKRKARVVYANTAKQVIEAQYQDAVRMRIDDVYAAFVDVLDARQTLRFSRKSVDGLTTLLQKTELLYKRDQATRADVSRVSVQLSQAQVGLLDAEEMLRQKKRSLGTLLNLPPQEAEQIEVRGSIDDDVEGLPPENELISAALAVRPDLVSYRLGVQSAEANVRLQRANRFSDVYVLYQPYTFQNNQPYGIKSATSWALGVTVPLPVYNRNQGGIERARMNVTQTQIELASLQRQVITDVQQAIKEYEVTRRMVHRIREELLPNAMRVRDDTYRLYIGGEVNVIIYLNEQKNFNDTVKQYTDTVVRHRRSMLALNTVLAQRMLP